MSTSETFVATIFTMSVTISNASQIPPYPPSDMIPTSNSYHRVPQGRNEAMTIFISAISSSYRRQNTVERLTVSNALLKSTTAANG